jgi:hypothetical protein
MAVVALPVVVVIGLMGDGMFGCAVAAFWHSAAVLKVPTLCTAGASNDPLGTLF